MTVLAVLLAFLLRPVPDAKASEGIVFGVHPYKPAVELEFMFAPLTGYLSSIVGKPVRLSISKDFDEHSKRIGEGQVDIAFMGPATCVEMVEEEGQKTLLARFETNRVPTCYGVIAVKNDSDIKLLKDLKGRKMTFSDRKSIGMPFCSGQQASCRHRRDSAAGAAAAAGAARGRTCPAGHEPLGDGAASGG